MNSPIWPPMSPGEKVKSLLHNAQTHRSAVTYQHISANNLCRIVKIIYANAASHHQTQRRCPCESIRLRKCVQAVSQLQRWDLKAADVNSQCEMFDREEKKSYQGALRFHRPSSVQFSHNSEPQRRCPTPKYYLCKEISRGHTQLMLLSSILNQKLMTFHLSCLLSLFFVTLKVNDGDSGNSVTAHLETKGRK